MMPFSETPAPQSQTLENIWEKLKIEYSLFNLTERIYQHLEWLARYVGKISRRSRHEWMFYIEWECLTFKSRVEMLVEKRGNENLAGRLMAFQRKYAIPEDYHEWTQAIIALMQLLEGTLDEMNLLLSDIWSPDKWSGGFIESMQEQTIMRGS